MGGDEAVDCGSVSQWEFQRQCPMAQVDRCRDDGKRTDLSDRHRRSLDSAGV
jgi:hypothetical protein